jgi:hypothetical protein
MKPEARSKKREARSEKIRHRWTRMEEHRAESQKILTGLTGLSRKKSEFPLCL